MVFQSMIRGVTDYSFAKRASSVDAIAEAGWLGLLKVLKVGDVSELPREDQNQNIHRTSWVTPIFCASIFLLKIFIGKSEKLNE